jgi:glycosyltransferase involved in cell wall biosynthesis
MHVRANYFIPDARKGWKTYALKAAEKVINQNDIDLIISTGPPHSTHLIGMELQEKHNIPWVADMRDPWTEIHYNKDLPRSEKTKEKDIALERKVLTTASHVITVSDGLKEQLEKYNEATSVVYNGFDEDDYKPLEPFKTEKFTLAYIGNLKPNQHIKTLWRVLLELCNENEQFKQHFKLELTGNVHEVIVNEIKSLGLENNLNAYPFVEHKESVKRMQKSCMLLFIVPQTEKNNLILTGKLFEYLASGTPLLSIGPVAGNAAKIIAGCSRGTLLDYNNEIGIKESLLKAFDSWMSSSQECPQLIVNSEIEQYSRQLQTKKLVSFFDKIVE